jgi:VWFA-related protein
LADHQHRNRACILRAHAKLFGLACLGLALANCHLANGQQSAAQQSTAQQGTDQQGPAPQNPVLLHRLTGVLDNASIAGGRIRLDVIVTDPAGKPVAGLAAQDFTLLADKEPQKLVSFEAYGGGADQPEQPVQLIVVIDAVNNGFSELGLMRQGVERFLRQNGGRLAHPVSLILFTADGAQALAPPSTDGNQLADLVKQIKPSVRNLGLEPFPLSIRALARIAQDETKVEGRKLLLWLGPGWESPIPNPSVMTARDEQNRKDYFDYGILLSTRLRQARIALYGGYAAGTYFDRDFLKGVRRVTDEDPRDLSLGVLAIESGGRGGLAYINRDVDTAEQLNSFAAEADVFYTLSFSPPPNEPLGDYRDLKVVVDKPGLTARTNTGYYNQPDWVAPQPAPVNAAGTKAGVAAVTAFVGKPVPVAELEKTGQRRCEEARCRPGQRAL